MNVLILSDCSRSRGHAPAPKHRLVGLLGKVFGTSRLAERGIPPLHRPTLKSGPH